MALIFKLMNLLLTLTVMVALSVILPLSILMKVFRYIKTSLFLENVAGKVILITGAASGIGESIAYEYARKGACLALADRTKDRLDAVADKARKLGSPDVILIHTDVSNIEDCKKFINEAFNHFGRLDHLINNAGIGPISMLEDCKDFSSLVPVMDVNFWGSVHCGHFAVPHLKKTKGKIVVIASMAPWLSMPKLSIYNASKAALVSFYETMRAECGSDIGITIVTPGLVQSGNTTPDFLSEFGMKSWMAESPQMCAKAIVGSARRGDMYLAVPSGMKVMFLLRTLCPEFLETILHWQIIQNRTASKKKL